MQDTIPDVADGEIDSDSGGVPGHFWAVVAVGLLWNGYGAYDYTSYQLGMTAPIPAVDAAPMWATAGWAFGVWSSFAGSVFMLLRTRHAVTAFAISLLGALVSFGWQFSAGIVPSPVLPAMIILAVIFFWWYASRMRDRGVLR